VSNVMKMMTKKRMMKYQKRRKLLNWKPILRWLHIKI